MMYLLVTNKGDMPQYVFIFRNTDPLGTELKNMVCYMLVTMLYLEIQKAKEAMTHQVLNRILEEQLLE